MVVKKNKAVLAKLVKDLKRIGATDLGEIPALIIDDESDQASVNTIRPARSWNRSAAERTAINSLLTELLSSFRAPSTSATPRRRSPTSSSTRATPRTSSRRTSSSRSRARRATWASATSTTSTIRGGRPDGRANSNEKAHVRGIWEPHDESTDQLLRAMDTFVLTGALKLYRDAAGVPGDFRHHTMLVARVGAEGRPREAGEAASKPCGRRRARHRRRARPPAQALQRGLLPRQRRARRRPPAAPSIDELRSGCRHAPSADRRRGPARSLHR